MPSPRTLVETVTAATDSPLTWVNGSDGGGGGGGAGGGGGTGSVSSPRTLVSGSASAELSPLVRVSYGGGTGRGDDGPGGGGRRGERRRGLGAHSGPRIAITCDLSIPQRTEEGPTLCQGLTPCSLTHRSAVAASPRTLVTASRGGGAGCIGGGGGGAGASPRTSVIRSPTVASHARWSHAASPVWAPVAGDTAAGAPDWGWSETRRARTCPGCRHPQPGAPRAHQAESDGHSSGSGYNVVIRTR